MRLAHQAVGNPPWPLNKGPLASAPDRNETGAGPTALLRGEKVDPSHICFRTVIRFETASAAHDRLNPSLFLSVGERQADWVLLRLTKL